MTFKEESRLEAIWEGCFCGSGIEEITLPDTVKEVGEGAFDNCSYLKVVWVEEGCVADVRRYVGDGVEVRRK